MRDMRDEFGRTLLDATARDQIALAVREAGLKSDPPLEGARRHDRLQLSTRDRRGSAPLTPGQTVMPSTDPLDDGAGDAAIGAVALTGLVATVAGFIVFGFVGGLFLLGLGVLLLVLVAGSEWSARRSLLISAICLLLISLLVIAPLTADEDGRKPVRPSKAQPDRVSVLHASAERELDAGNYDNALRIADNDLRDRGLARRIRSRAARELLDQAAPVVYDSPRRALRLSRRAGRYEASVRARQLEDQAQGVIAAEQAVAEPDPPVEESDPLPDDPGDSGSGAGSSDGGSSGFACGPGDRDGDGDGRCNE